MACVTCLILMFREDMSDAFGAFGAFGAMFYVELIIKKWRRVGMLIKYFHNKSDP